jgi:hypothetical protein
MLVPTFQPYVIYERTPPEGTVPQHPDGIEIGIPSAPLAIVFINIRDETSSPPDPTEPPDTTELPDTGAGLTALAAPGDAWVPVLLAGTLLLIIGGVHFRAPLER